VLRAVFVVLLFLPMLPTASGALQPTQAMLAERSQGSPFAKVAIIEYSSLTCSYCANFHGNVLPLIYQGYINRGVVLYILRDFPSDPLAVAAAMIARCVPPDLYFSFVDLLFRDQQIWAFSADPLNALKMRAQQAGLSPAEVDACLADQNLLNGILARVDEASQLENIEATPTFFINGKRIDGAAPYDTFRPAIDEALRQASAR
jgi:protein-disulfide isomerase